MEGDTNSVNDRYAKLIGDSWWAQFRGSNPWMARYVYGLMFLIVNLLAWGIRDYGRSALSEMKSKNTAFVNSEGLCFSIAASFIDLLIMCDHRI